jgi:hypothetical protein
MAAADVLASTIDWTGSEYGWKTTTLPSTTGWDEAFDLGRRLSFIARCWVKTHAHLEVRRARSLTMSLKYHFLGPNFLCLLAPAIFIFDYSASRDPKPYCACKSAAKSGRRRGNMPVPESSLLIKMPPRTLLPEKTWVALRLKADGGVWLRSGRSAREPVAGRHS